MEKHEDRYVLVVEKSFDGANTINLMKLCIFNLM